MSFRWWVVAAFAQIWGGDNFSGGQEKSESQRAQRKGENTELGRRFRGRRIAKQTVELYR